MFFVTDLTIVEICRKKKHMSRKPLPIKISERVKRLLSKELNRRQLESFYKVRMQIILLSSSGKGNQEIATVLTCSVITVRKWRRIWYELEDVISKQENDCQNEKSSDLLLVRNIKLVLTDAPRSGSSSRITDAEKVRLQALACQEPQEFNLPFTNWTHVELSKQAGLLGITISSSYYGKLLKKRIETS